MIYLDHAATTPLDKDVLKAMEPYLTNIFGNPQSQHSYGREAANAVQRSRDKIAEIMGVSADNLYFTSGGTEAGNTALKGICMRYKPQNAHIVISAFEHPALIESAKDMEKVGYAVTRVNPDSDGYISPDSIAAAITDKTVFVGVMAANNEVGTVQPIEDIYKVCKERGVFFYCDCVQTAGVLPFNKFPADGIGFSAHKFYGPKGFGGLYINKKFPFNRLISGGVQERGLRGGTTYVAGAVGCACALEKAVGHMAENAERVTALRDMFMGKVLGGIDGAYVNGGMKCRLPANANISFDGCDGEQVVFALDLKGVAASTGSACSSGAVTPSHVLLSMGLGEVRAKSAVRFTFGRDNTEEEVRDTVRILKDAVSAIRRR